MIEILTALLFWILLLPALWCAGSCFGNRFFSGDLFWQGILRFAFGFGIFACYLTAVGTLKWLKPAAYVFFVVAAWFAGRKHLPMLGVWLWERIRFKAEETRTVLLLKCLLGMVLAVTFIFCFLPEIANDALSIQLYLPKLFVEQASLAPRFYDIASYRPLLMNVLYASGLLFQSVSAAKLFHWFAGVLLTGAVIHQTEQTTKNRLLALFMGLMLWLTPTLLNQITTTYIDAGVSLFVFLGFCMVCEGFKRGRLAGFLIAGFFMGLAVAMRYLALGAAGAAGLLICLYFFKPARKFFCLRAAVIFSTGVLLSAGYWFLRDWYATGNPVYPYFGKLFGTQDFDFFSSIYFHGMGLPRSPLSFLMLPWDLTFRPQAFDYHHWIGPFYLLVFPAAVFAVFRYREMKVHAFFIGAGVLFWYFTGQNVRYLLPFFPVYLVLAAVGLIQAESLKGKRWVLPVFKSAGALTLLFLLLLGCYHFRYQFFPVLGLWSREEYLAKMERTIPAARAVNQILPEKARVLMLNEPRLFYFNRSMLLEFDFNARTHYEKSANPAEMAQIFKNAGITHVMDMQPINAKLPAPARAVDFLLNSGQHAVKESEIDSENIVGGRFRYTLYRLIA